MATEQAGENADFKQILEDRQKINTCDLVRALSDRAGVKSILVKPYETKSITIEGPKIVLVIED